MTRAELKFALLGAVVGLFMALAPSCACQTTCGPENCAGCCGSANQCLTGDTEGACGATGASCTACGTGDVCTGGVCAPASGDGGADGGQDAGPGKCLIDDDCAYLKNGSVCDNASGECITGQGCNIDSECQSADPANPCYQYGTQCRCALGDAPDAGSLGSYPGTCRRRKGPCQTCTQDTECGVGPIFTAPDGIGEGRCKTLQGDTTGAKYCLYERVGQCPCGTVDDGTGFCRPQNNSCQEVGCRNDRNCPSGSVCTANLPEDGGADCGGICVPRCRWDFVGKQLAAPGCGPGKSCWVDSANLDPASQYYGSGRCLPPCTANSDCTNTASNPFGGPNLKCAAEQLPGGGLSDKRCRADGECMDDNECPEQPPTAIPLGYCDRGAFQCKTDCRTGADPVTGKGYRDCRPPYACAADGGTNFCRLLSCVEQGGAALACRRGEYCCGEDKNNDGTADPCAPVSEQDPAGCYTAAKPPYCTTCMSNDDCANVQLPAYLSGANACTNGSRSPSCSALPMRCVYAGDKGMAQGVNICAPSTYNDNTQDAVGLRRSQRGCPAGYQVTFVRPNLANDGENFCTTDSDCNQGTDAGRCADDFTARKDDGGYRKACLCNAGTARSQCPNDADAGLVTECRTGVSGQPTHCIESVVCVPPPGVAYLPPGDPQYGCGL